MQLACLMHAQSDDISTMVDVVQSVEHQIVVLDVAGSSPVIHPCAPVAQLDRAPDFESVGRRFESCRAYKIWAVSSAGRAADS